MASLIGEGGMGQVYMASHPTLQRRAAVKILHAHLATDPHIVSRFLNEARAAATIRHPNIVEVIDCGSLDDGPPYILMEYLEGEPLSLRMGRGLRMREAVDIAIQTAAGLSAAHARGIVHRDLKPDNLFLVPDAQRPGRDIVKVLDFGIAKLQDPGALMNNTVAGTLLGTPLYMSPEQCKGADVDARSDIYSLGVILYELLCGRPPFESPGAGALIFLHANAAPPSPRHWNPRIPHRLETVILRMLAKTPEARYQSMDAVRLQLETALTSTRHSWPDLKTPLPAAILDESGVPSASKHAFGRWAKLVFAAAACAAVAGGTEIIRRREGAVPMGSPPAVSTAHVPQPTPAPVPRGASAAQPDANTKSSRPASQVSTALPGPDATLPTRVTMQLLSTPPGSTVSARGVVIGLTPTSYQTASSDEPIAFTFSHPGYLPAVVKALPAQNLRLQARLQRRPGGAAAHQERDSAAPVLPEIMTER